MAEIITTTPKNAIIVRIEKIPANLTGIIIIPSKNMFFGGINLTNLKKFSTILIRGET